MLLLHVGAEPDENLTGDAVVRAEHGRHRERTLSEFHGELDVLHQIQAETTPVLRDRVAEQCHVRRLLAQIVRDGVGRHDLELPGRDSVPDEVAHGSQDIVEDISGDVGASCACIFARNDRTGADKYSASR